MATNVQIEGMKKDIEYIKQNMQEINDKIDAINKKLDEKFVTKQEFDPIKKLAYGIVTLILSAVVIAGIGLIIIK